MKKINGEHVPQPSAFIGKLSNTYHAPSHHTSSLIRRLQNQNRSINPRDRVILSFYSELESIRLRNTVSPTIPKKSDLYELSLHELWGHASPKSRLSDEYNDFYPSTVSGSFTNGGSLDNNVIACTTESVNEENLYLQAMRVFDMQPKIAHYMLCNAKANVLQEYCWPVFASQSEVSRMEDFKQKRAFHRSVFDSNRIGDTSTDRFLMLSNEVKSFIPQLDGGKVVWSENFHVVPRHRAFERNLRQPPTILIEMARQGIHHQVANDGFITLKRPKLIEDDKKIEKPHYEKPIITGKNIVDSSIASISIQGITTRSLPGLKPKEVSHQSVAHRLAHERILRPHSFARAPSVKESLQEQVFELAIARYLEAILDSLLETIFQFLLPILQIAADKVEPVGEDSNGTFKLRLQRLPVQSAETNHSEEEMLLKYLSQSAVMAIDSVQYLKNQENIGKSELVEADTGPSQKSAAPRKKRRRGLHIACHQEQLLVEYSPTSSSSSSSSELPPRKKTRQQLASIENSSRERKTLRVKRRRLDIQINIPEQDRQEFDRRVLRWRQPKTIQGLRAHLKSINGHANKLDARDVQHVTAWQPSLGNDDDGCIESISDDSSSEENVAERESRDAIIRSKQSSKKGNISSDSKKTTMKNDARTKIISSSKQTLKNKKLVPENVPLPVPLAQIFLSKSWSYRRLLGIRMLRWQKAGILGSGKTKANRVIRINSLRPMYNAYQRKLFHERKRKMRKAADLGVTKKNKFTENEESDDDSVLSAITGEIEEESVYKPTDDASLSLSSIDLPIQSRDPTSFLPEKLLVAAPSLPGTLEAGYIYREPMIDSKSGNFQTSSGRNKAASILNRSTSAVFDSSAPDKQQNYPLPSQERQLVNWEHILTILELVRDITSRGIKPTTDKEPIIIRIHPDLPPLPIDDLALKRIRYRLIALFTNFLRENEPQHHPRHRDDKGPAGYQQNIASAPSLIRQSPYFPIGPVSGETNEKLPPSFLLCDPSTLRDLSNKLNEMPYTGGSFNETINKNSDDFNDNGFYDNSQEDVRDPQKRKRVRFTPSDIGENHRSLGTAESNKNFANKMIQRTFGYGNISATDLLASAASISVAENASAMRTVNDDARPLSKTKFEKSTSSSLEFTKRVLPRPAILAAHSLASAEKQVHSVKHRSSKDLQDRMYPKNISNMKTGKQQQKILTKNKSDVILVDDGNDDDFATIGVDNPYDEGENSSSYENEFEEEGVTSRQKRKLSAISSSRKPTSSSVLSPMRRNISISKAKSEKSPAQPNTDCDHGLPEPSILPITSFDTNLHEYDAYPLLPSAYIASPSIVGAAAKQTTNDGNIMKGNDAENVSRRKTKVESKITSSNRQTSKLEYQETLPTAFDEEEEDDDVMTVDSANL